MRKNKLLLLLALLMTAATGAWAQDYYAPSTDEVIILNDVYEYTYNGKSSHSAIAWGGAATPYMRNAGDPNNEGVSTSSTVSCYSVKGTGQGKDITLSITGVSKVIVYHERNSSRYIELRDGSKTGNIIGSGEKNTWYTEVELTATNQYSIFLHGTSTGSNDQDFYVYAIKLIAAAAAPADPAAAAGYTVSLKDNVKDADKWTISPNPAEEGQTVTLQYTGRLKVKGVKATSDEKAAAWDGTITAQLAAKLAYTGGNTTDGLTTMTWAVGEHIAILYEVSGTKKVADAEITAVDGTTGAATIQFTVEDGTPDNTACTLVYPYSAAKDDHTGVKDAATLLAAQDGTLSANLDVRVGAGTIQTTTPGLTVTTQPAAQFAIFKFTTKNADGSAPINVKPLTVTIGAQNYVITPALATSELYVALPAVSDQAVRFSATSSDSKTYTCSKASVTFAAGKYYQSMLKMAPPITVTWNSDDITGSGNSFTKDGVTINAGSIDFDEKQFEENGEFTTTLGNFTKIEVVVTNGFCDVSGTGWSGNEDKRTWTGNASSVSFIGDIYGDGNGIKFVFTIEP